MGSVEEAGGQVREGSGRGSARSLIHLLREGSTNAQLSRQRANSVKRALVEAGIKAERISPEGFGASHPIASNDNAEGRAKNRRLQIIVENRARATWTSADQAARALVAAHYTYYGLERLK